MAVAIASQFFDSMQPKDSMRLIGLLALEKRLLKRHDCRVDADDSADLDEAIRLGRMGIKLTPAGDSGPVALLENFNGMLLMRSEKI